MHDQKQTFTNTRMHAEGTITYGTPNAGQYASGTITITDYTKLVAAKAIAAITYGAPTAGVQATGTVTVADWSLMASVKASATITITNYALLVGETVTVDGHALVEGVDWTAAVSNGDTATSLAAAIDGLTSFEAAAVGAVITAQVSTAGTAGNSKALSSTDAVHMTLSGTLFSGGRDAMSVTVNGTALVANVDFTAETDNGTTAANLAVAIAALSGVTAAAVDAVITVTADAHGVAGNAITLATSYAGAASVSGAHLTGGVAGDTVVVNGTTLTCVDKNAGAGQFTDIAGLEALTEAISGIDSSQDGTTVSLVAATAGEAGNALTLALGGSNTGTMTVSGATFTGGRDHAVFTLDDVIVTQGTGFTAETSNSVTATNIAAALDAATNGNASAVGAVVTCVAADDGTDGNAIVFTQDVTAGSTISGSGTLAGGTAGDTVIVNGNTFKCVASGAGGGEFTNAAGLAVLINALANISAANSSGTITIKADAVGVTGNTYTLALGEHNTGTMSISGATLTGGAAALYSDPFDLGQGDDSYDVKVKITAISGGATIDITPEGSDDGGDTYDTAESEAEAGLAFTQFTTTGTDKQYVKLASPRNRLKIVLGGTSPTFSGVVTWVSRND